MPSKLSIPPAADLLSHGFVHGPDDFTGALNTILWAQSGGSIVAGATGGQVKIATNTTDNNAAYLKSAGQPFKFTDGKKFVAEWLAKFTEGGTAGSSNFFMGVANVGDATIVADNGAGLPADWHGMGFYTVDGSNKLAVAVSVGTANTKIVMNAADRNNFTKEDVLASSANWRLFRIEIEEVGPNDFHANFFVDGVLLTQCRFQSLANPTAMGLLFAVKTGDTTADEILFDHIYGAQAR